MSYYFEIWLRGPTGDILKSLSTKSTEKYHPHITLVRPFDISTSEEAVKEKAVHFCRGAGPIRFCLEGKGNFDEKFYYVPVTEGENLLQFSEGLEWVVTSDAIFVPKLGDKTLHATVDAEKDFPSCPKIEDYMLRLTAMRKKQIWFSYDFVTQKLLNGEESLDEKRWERTVHEFKKQTQKHQTNNRFMSSN